MSDINEADLTALLAELRHQAANGYMTCQYAALRALIAERDGLRNERDALLGEVAKEVTASAQRASDLIAERNALKTRVMALEKELAVDTMAVIAAMRKGDANAE